MPIAECAGVHGCQRSISISAVPGGNPAANADPAGYAAEWTFCSNCKSYTCDRCLARQHGRCRCGAPARLFTEAERIHMANGGPPPAPDAAMAGRALAPAAASFATAGSQLRMMLEGIGLQIDADLGRSNVERARAMASLAATLMMTQGRDAVPADVAWLMWYGEGFYRWSFFAEGAEYWKGVFQVLKRLGRHEAEDGVRAVATAGAFQVLSGELGPEAAHAHSVAAFVSQVYGPAHVLTRDVIARLGPAPQAAALASPQAVNLSPAPPRLPPELAALDGPTQLALWVTLAFLDVGNADGRLDDIEYASWKQTMARMRLPDVWERFGFEELQRMLRGGVLHALSANFATLPDGARAKLGGVLVDFMMADGRVDAGEVQAIRRIGGWLGVTLELG